MRLVTAVGDDIRDALGGILSNQPICVSAEYVDDRLTAITMYGAHGKAVIRLNRGELEVLIPEVRK